MVGLRYAAGVSQDVYTVRMIASGAPTPLNASGVWQDEMTATLSAQLPTVVDPPPPPPDPGTPGTGGAPTVSELSMLETVVRVGASSCTFGVGL